MEFKFAHTDRIYKVDLEKEGTTYKATIDGTTYEVTDVDVQNNILFFRFNDKLYSVYFAEEKEKKYMTHEGEYFVVEFAKEKIGRAKDPGFQKENSVASPMPGLLVKLQVTVGDEVKIGKTLAIVESMKMQNELQAPCDGIIKKINFKEGDQIDAFQAIVELETSKK